MRASKLICSASDDAEPAIMQEKVKSSAWRNLRKDNYCRIIVIHCYP